MNTGNKIFKGIVWSAIERISIQGVQFILGVVLARLLTPTEYGTIGLLLVFIALSNVFIDSGFTKALIQKTDRTENDKSTVFIFNIGISVFCYLILWFLAPFIAEFYNLIELITLLRILALSLIINALFAVPSTMLIIRLDFKLFTKINLTTTLISGITAIFLAYMGLGVWALVFQTILKSLLTAIIMWLAIKWRPNFIFSKSSFSSLFSYGSKLLISNLLGAFSSQINALLIGKYIGAKELGVYTRGIQFSDIIYGIFSASISNVLLPGLAPFQHEKEILVSHTRKIIKTAAVVVIPIFMMLSIFSEPLIRVLITDKWIAAAPIMAIFCIARLISTMSGININVLYVIGRTDLVLKQQYLNIAVRVILLLFALQFGIYYIALAELTSTTIHFFINSYYPGKIMGYGSFKQIKDMSIIIFAGGIMTLGTYYFIEILNNDYLKIGLGFIVASFIYFLLIYLLKVDELKLIINKIHSLFKINQTQ